jgi:hypothetical protein
VFTIGTVILAAAALIWRGSRDSERIKSVSDIAIKSESATLIRPAGTLPRLKVKLERPSGRSRRPNSFSGDVLAPPTTPGGVVKGSGHLAPHEAEEVQMLLSVSNTGTQTLKNLDLWLAIQFRAQWRRLSPGKFTSHQDTFGTFQVPVPSLRPAETWSCAIVNKSSRAIKIDLPSYVECSTLTAAERVRIPLQGAGPQNSWLPPQ